MNNFESDSLKILDGWSSEPNLGFRLDKENMVKKQKIFKEKLSLVDRMHSITNDRIKRTNSLQDISLQEGKTGTILRRLVRKLE